MKTPLLRPLLILLLCSLASACNTARGFGEDIQHLGGAIERAAK
ncbi:entericidin A/B family lipoprotein [Cronobacter turicensis]|nr:entericidin A/B family lipoprotein [Cronobacter turicensis]EKY3118731.1 entericidin A/B family lipoprotein [Cronobacter turicensis]ELU8455723.1 entericidin A/B family lipoprotein [Cronobacter turicensis]ELY4111225.1 entericidin A/B family lipoprotein [Cronobacter turicensis]ELY4217591.1 entericidin A/B family lipoprotein [Cronobacter turicensis]EMA1792630.1 entericidin A/B family lipoprotein [Cronobacter turicensis]